MNTQPWWERHPSWLQQELDALNEAGIRWEIDEDARAAGVLRLKLKMVVGESELPLEAVFPDQYPYFRCEVVAPTLQLPLHQHPFGHNLCLLPRRTHYWNPDETVAALLTEQLTKLLTAARASDRTKVSELEQHQGEPFTDYYPYHPQTIVVVQSDWSLTARYQTGRLLIGTSTHPNERPDKFFRGAVWEIQDADGKTLLTADKAIRDAFPRQGMTAVWSRLPRPMPTDNPVHFIEQASQLQRFDQAQPFHVSDGWLQVWGFVFPEEITYNTSGDAWVFIAAYHKNRPDVPRPHWKHAKGKQDVKKQPPYRGKGKR